jgi:hypothetical protein
MRQLFLIAAFLFLNIILFAQGNRDFQLWNTTSFSHKFSEKTELAISEKIHYSPELEGLEMKFGQILINYRFTGWLSMGTGFRLTASKELGQWIYEQRPMVLFSINKKVNKINFILTNRFEYRFFKYKNDQFRDVQKFDITSPTVTNWGIGLFATEEAFYVPVGCFLDMIRFYAGISVFENHKVGLKFFYAYQLKNVEPLWNKTDILGMNISLSI